MVLSKDPVRGEEVLTLRAPAKVNLYLRVEGRRADGYHNLHMLMAPVNLYDTLRLRQLPGPDRVEVTLAGDGQRDVPAGEENLCHAAARFFLDQTGVRGGVHVELTKRIPAGAGLGGGSSDAAATLLGLERMFQRRLSPEQRCRAAFEVGADVPFFFARGGAWVSGIGDIVVPQPTLPRLWLVLVFPGVFLSTGKVFSRFIRGLTTPGQPPTIAQFNFRGLVAGLYNDLQQPAVETEPVIGDALKALAAAGARGRLMSGSGSTVFGLFPTAAAAREGAAALRRFPEVASWLVETVQTLPSGAFPFPTS